MPPKTSETAIEDLKHRSSFATRVPAPAGVAKKDGGMLLLSILCASIAYAADSSTNPEVFHLFLGVAFFEVIKEVTLFILEWAATMSHNMLDDHLVELVHAELRHPATRVVYGICSIYATCSALGLSPVKHLLKNASFFGAAELTIRVEALSLSDDFQAPLAFFSRLLCGLVVVARLTSLVTQTIEVVVAVTLEESAAADVKTANSNQALSGAPLQKKQLEAVSGTPLVLIGRYATMFVGLATVGVCCGVDVQSAVAGLGIGGMALAFGLKEIVQDAFYFICLLADRPFHVGSDVSLHGVWGTVEAIGVKSIRLRDFDGHLHIFATHTLASAHVINNTKDEVGRHRGCVSVELAINTPPEKLDSFSEAMKKAIEAEDKVHFMYARCNGEGQQLRDWGFVYKVFFHVDGANWTGDHETRAYRRVLGAVKSMGIQLAGEARLQALAGGRA